MTLYDIDETDGSTYLLWMLEEKYSPLMVRNDNLLYHIQPLVLVIQYWDYKSRQRIEVEYEHLKARCALQKQHRENIKAHNWRASKL